VSPGAALGGDVFRTYVLIVAVVLVGAGAVLCGLKVAGRATAGHAWAAYRGWLYMAPVVLLGLFLGREATIVLLTLVAVLGFGELVRVSDLARAPAITAVAGLGIVAGGVVALMADPSASGPEWPPAFAVLPVYVVPLVFLVPIAGNRTVGQLRVVGLAVLGYVLLGFMFGHLALLANTRHAYGHLLFLLLAVEVSDVAAYATGRWLGRRPLRSRISPAKTWEGAAGGLVTAMALPWLLRFSLPDLGAGHLVMAGLGVGVGGQLGDLSLSLVKRELGVKDMGSLIPGHGGILDRIDSLIFAAPLFYHLVAGRAGP
jgi:phosphatidate cytidylyltransferase